MAPKVMVWLAGVTVNSGSPEWRRRSWCCPAELAWIVQVPVLGQRKGRVDAVQTDTVVEVKLTARPEDAVALTAN